MDAVGDFSFEYGMVAETSISRESNFKCSFDFTNQEFKREDVSSSGDVNEDIENPVRVGFWRSNYGKASFSGFYGLRPAIQPMLKFGGADFHANLGFKVGMKASVQWRTQPFQADTNSGYLKIGVCSGCHLVEGTVSFVAKDLSYQYKIPGSDETEVLVNLAVSVEKLIAKICAFQATCPSTRTIIHSYITGQEPEIDWVI